jgi:membrane fusion protein, copper/silver efflux system
MKAARAIGALLLIAAAFAGGYVYKAVRESAGGGAKSGRKVLYWVDPMHPSYKSDKPGIAPDCGMKLEPVYEDSGAKMAVAREPMYYRDPKQPSYRAKQPGFNPETGNELEPVYAEDSKMMPGAVQLSSERQQLIGVRTAQAEMGGGTKTFRTVGRVVIDEPRVGRVRSRVEGWVDSVFVDFVGQRVQRNAALMTLYSPEVLAAEREMLLVARSSESMKDSALPEAFDPAGALLQAAKRRLELWGLTQGQINQILKSGEPIKTITLYSPVAGYITDLKATPGTRVTPEIDLFTVVDTSQVQVQADVFAYDVGDIRVGDRAKVSLLALPGKVFTASIGYLQPQSDATSPTYKVRLDMGNPGLALKPDMYAEVEFTVEQPPRLSVPTEAVLDTGKRKLVYLDRGNGIFEPREVETGARDSGRVEITGGLKAGDRVVTSGAFLLDSESQLRAPAMAGAKKVATGLGSEGEK